MPNQNAMMTTTCISSLSAYSYSYSYSYSYRHDSQTLQKLPEDSGQIEMQQEKGQRNVELAE